MRIRHLDILEKPRVCLCVKAGEDTLEGIEYSDLIEARIDYAQGRSAGSIREELERLRGYGKPVILTNRRVCDGGVFKGSEEERLSLMESLLDHVDCIDVELTADAGELIRKARDRGVKVIISQHNFNETPPEEEIRDILRRELEAGDIAKIAFKINHPRDILGIYRSSLGKEGEGPVIAVPMGDSLARIAGVLFKTPVIYSGGIAPGQLSAKDVRAVLDICGK